MAHLPPAWRQQAIATISDILHEHGVAPDTVDLNRIHAMLGRIYEIGRRDQGMEYHETLAGIYQALLEATILTGPYLAGGSPAQLRAWAALVGVDDQAVSEPPERI